MTSAPRLVPVPPDPQDAVERRLDVVLDRARAGAAAFGPRYVLLWDEIGRSVRGGKRFRSTLVLRTHAALGGRHADAAVSVACAFELLHTAFLIHDDLIDGDSLRRGAPNLAATMRADALEVGAAPGSAHRWSEAAAVLAGDLALGQAHRLMASVDVETARRVALLDLLDETLLVSAGGELADTAFGLGLAGPTLDEALLVAESKTAMYSFRAPLRAGGILAGASPSVLDALDHQGRLLGRAFQLVDDLLGVFAPEEETGKSNLSDLREGKCTPLILHARDMPVWEELGEHLGRPDLDQPTAARLRRALARSVAPLLVQDAVRSDLDEVTAGLGALPPALAPVIGSVVAQIARALHDVTQHIEGARCQVA
jgi:geranylgeranyl diphosphate synthase type II